MFTFKDSRFLLFILNKVPEIKTYLHKVNPETKWLPLFRILNIFGSEFYFVNDRKRFETAQEILKALFRLDYDFLLISGHQYYDLPEMNTLEMMMTVPIDAAFFKQIIDYI